MKRSRVSVICLILLVGLSTAQCGYAQQETAPAPAFTESEARRYMAEVLPAVEKAAGRELKKTPALTVVEVPRLRLTQISFATAVIRELAPQLTETQVERRIKFESARLSTRVMGMYDPRSDSIRLFPGNYIPRMEQAHVDTKYLHSILKLAIAHELAHAMQDRYARFHWSRNLPWETQMAYWAAMEGYATFIQTRVADMLDLRDAQNQFVRMISHGMIISDDVVGKGIASMFTSAYLGGRDFYLWQYNHGGVKRVWQILSAPPTTTAMILEPWTYSLRPAPANSYSTVLEGLGARFGMRKWQAENRTVTEFEVKAILQALDPQLTATVIPKMEHTQMLTVLGDAPGEVALVVLRDPTALPSLLSGVEKSLLKDLKAPLLSPSVKVYDVTSGPFEKLPLNTARKISFTVHSGNSSFSRRIVYIVRGRAMVEIRAQGSGPTDEEIASIADDVFQRLSKLRSGRKTVRLISPGRKEVLPPQVSNKQARPDRRLGPLVPAAAAPAIRPLP